jgi:hypothetical protein
MGEPLIIPVSWHEFPGLSIGKGDPDIAQKISCVDGIRLRAKQAKTGIVHRKGNCCREGALQRPPEGPT